MTLEKNGAPTTKNDTVPAEPKMIDGKVCNPNPKKIEQIYYDYVRDRNLVTRNEIVKMNQPLVSYIISKYYNKNRHHKVSREDLFQEGTIGLISAIEGYKPELGYKFSTYATWWIRQAINNFLLNVEPIIHVPSHIRTANNKLHRSMKEENIDYQEACAKSEISDKMFHAIACAAKSRNISSFDEPVGRAQSGGGTFLSEIIPSEDDDSGMVYDNTNLIHFTKKALTLLSEKERYILLLRFDVINSVPLKSNRSK